MSKYKVGDRVKVREDLNYDIKNPFGVTSKMLEYKGKEVTIESIYYNGECIEYRFEEIGYTWTDECIVCLTEEVKPKYVKCITSEFRNITKDEVYEVLKEEYVGYILKQGRYSKKYFIEVDSPVEPIQSIPNKGTIKYRITDDGVTYVTLNGSKTGKSVKSNKDESDNNVGILIATCRLLNISEDKISGIVDVLFDDSYNSKVKCDNAIMKNDIARALSILDKYKEV